MPRVAHQIFGDTWLLMGAETFCFVSVLLQKVGLAHLFRICLLKLKD
jgi:hypothetical protein